MGGPHQPVSDWPAVVVRALRGLPGGYWLLPGGLCVVLLAAGLLLPGGGRGRRRRRHRGR